jgi:hypothetical protein
MSGRGLGHGLIIRPGREGGPFASYTTPADTAASAAARIALKGQANVRPAAPDALAEALRTCCYFAWPGGHTRLPACEAHAMPSLLRFLTAIAVIGGLVYGVIFALANFVDPKPREMTISIAPDKFLKR